ncbi:hypothetical protein F8R89_15385 [Streptomyces sp. SS1-1]|uniref:hypothetical protein n=1 Tax=Streptomyces sp. SS1-1 TaxID=2651869 RepID=UPI00124F9E96|nr:hypothetical protein [Streptomyces sp. SS1-1]KAB2973283.1 hypothetical protein F8R89_15385 [Streptomyces sp. SS1-1]
MWTTFAATVGGSAAGLTGLTFIVVAFRFDVVATSQEYRNRAAQTVSLFLTTTVTASLITLPQPTWALGVELLAAAAASATLLSVLDHAARRGTSRHARPTLVVALVALVAFAAGIATAGAFAATGSTKGLGFYAASALLGLTWGVYGTWVFLTQAGTDQINTAATAHSQPAPAPAA